MIVGGDVGGSSTRVAVADHTGRVLAVAVGGTGNPHIVGPTAAAAEIRHALSRAWAAVDSAQSGAESNTAPPILSCVIGLAGLTGVRNDASFAEAATPPLFPAPVFVSDVEVAFASATPRGSGSVVISGTGAIAGRIVDHQPISTQGGWGWLLGDAGSGYWLGREAVRSTLAAWDQGVPLGPLQREVAARTGCASRDELVAECYANPPSWLARFAELVSRHGDTDPLASRIVERAVDALVTLTASVQPSADEPLALAGSVLSPPSLVGRRFRARLDGSGSTEAAADRRTVACGEVVACRDGVVGALWTAARRASVGSEAVFHQLVKTAGLARCYTGNIAPDEIAPDEFG